MWAEAWVEVRGLLAGAIRDRSLHVAAILFAVVLATNLPLLPSDPLPADGASFTLAAVRAGQPHLPYPVHTLASAVFARLPFLTPALGVNLLSALAGAGAAAGVYLLARRLVLRMWPGDGRAHVAAHAGGIVAAFHLAFSASYWASSLTVEVYALSAMFLAVWLGLLLWWDARGTRGALVAAVFVYSLSLGLHYLNLAYLPVFAACVVTSRWRAAALGRRQLLILALAFVAGLLQFLYLPLRPVGPPPEVASLSAYWDFNLGAQVRNLASLGAAAGDGTVLPTFGRAFGGHLWNEFLLGGVVFAALGLWVWFRRERRGVALIAALFVLNRLAAVAVSDDPTLQDDIPFFLTSSSLLFTLPVGIGVAAACRAAGSARFRTARGGRTARVIRAVGLGGVLLAAGVSAWWLHFSNWEATQSVRRDAEASRIYSAALLENLPDESVVLADWAFATPLWYYQAAEGIGPAVSVLSLWTEERSLYVDDAPADRAIFLTEQPREAFDELPVSRYLRYEWMSAYRVVRRPDCSARCPRCRAESGLASGTRWNSSD